MKKHLSIIFLSISNLCCMAQNKYPEGFTKGKHDTFQVHNSKYVFNNQRSIYVYSTKNKYSNGVPWLKNQMELGPHDVSVDKTGVKNLVLDVLKNKIQGLHKNKEGIDVILTFEPTGILTDVAFSIKENSLITPQDIEAIDNMIRAEIKVTFKGYFYKTHAAVQATIPHITF